MKVELGKWGNSAAVRVPAFALADLDLAIGQTLELRIEAGRIVLEKPAETLDDLLARMTPENRPTLEWPDDAPRGNEAW